ncbi:MAG: magnesium chelatase [Leptospiraceae bacterium]|nr:hypothetical protein [Leptospiraceae bacterium]MCP5498456.1 magnesium chelatase [Leptospiraceae bacterium]
MNVEIKTFGELKRSSYRYRSIKIEMAENLAQKLKNRESVFPQVHGYEDTVIPQLIHAVLSGHNIVLLGEKGQAKTRIMRSLIYLLDEEIPVLNGTEIPESPFFPITSKGKKILSEYGDESPIYWLHREERYGERLAPGAKIGDIIGDLDPSRIVNGEPLSSEGAIHFGLLPRMNLGIFAVNEIPDLDYLVQVSLFNILEESDVQIRGIPVRFPLDVFICFTANPEDYSRSGKIITQLKDRVGSEIRTHYPKTRQIALQITRQETRLPLNTPEVKVPLFIEEIIEEITLQARNSHQINQKSGVSARLSIANMEIAISSARKRILITGGKNGFVRMTDLGNIIPSSYGKIELDPYRNENMDDNQVILQLLDKATSEVFHEYYSIEKYESVFNDVARQIYHAGKVEISDMMPIQEYRKILTSAPALWELMHEKKFDSDDDLFISGLEFILEGLTSLQKLSRRRIGSSSVFRTAALH